MILPLFPLRTVLFPGGRLPLRVFEARYMDMATASIKDQSPFGICLIASGEEVGRVARPHAIGTCALIADWDMPQLGVLNVTVQGMQRFRILRQWAEGSQLLRAEVELIDDEATRPVSGDYLRLVPLLHAMIAEMVRGGTAPTEPHRFADADWVGMRFAEMLPIQALAKQKLLEIEDSVDRLEIIYRFLDGKGLLPAI